MWDDCLDYFNINKVRFYTIDPMTQERVYKVNDRFVAIPESINKESIYKKAEYINNKYGTWLKEEEFEELVRYLNREEIPVATWHEPPKELTPDEKFENLKKKIRKRNTVKRKKKIKFMSGEWQRDHEMLASIIVVVFIFSVVLLFVEIIKTITIVIL